MTLAELCCFRLTSWIVPLRVALPPDGRWIQLHVSALVSPFLMTT